MYDPSLDYEQGEGCLTCLVRLVVSGFSEIADAEDPANAGMSQASRSQIRSVDPDQSAR